MPVAPWTPLDTLRAWSDNPRLNADAIPKVAASIRRFGFVAPIVVWEGHDRLVAGHTRMAALESILREEPDFVPPGAPPGTLPGTAPVVFHAFASEADANAYALADNKLNEVAKWDPKGLEALLGTLDAPTITLTGFVPPTVTLPDLGFLTELATREDGTEAPPQPSAVRPEGVPKPFRTLLLTLAPETEAEVQKTLRAVMKAQSLPTRDAAIVWLCEQYRNTHP